MDDDDRQEILEQFGVINENNHNTIGAVNKQTYINTQLNESMQTLKPAVEKNRTDFKNAFISFKNRKSEIIQRFTDIQTKWLNRITFLIVRTTFFTQVSQYL